MTPEELKNLLKIGQQFGLKRLRVTGDFMEAEFGPSLLPDGPAPTMPIGEALGGMPTEDEFLFASSIPLTEDEIAAGRPKQ